jgi:hypothetical protein
MIAEIIFGQDIPGKLIYQGFCVLTLISSESWS